MDINQIRALLHEWFSPRQGHIPMTADDDYAEAEMALNALRSLFETELTRRAKGTQGDTPLD
jgi:hypothetical protein